MNIDDYQQLAIRTASEFETEPEKRLLIWSVAWAGEVGEFCEMAALSVAPKNEEEQLLQQAALLAGAMGSFLNKLKKQIGHGHAITNEELAQQLETVGQDIRRMVGRLRDNTDETSLGNGTDSQPIDDHALKDEMGDGLWYPAAIAWLKGWRLSEPAQLNINKLARRYPDGFSQDRSINRTE
jgi:hypothetical protein